MATQVTRGTALVVAEQNKAQHHERRWVSRICYKKKRHQISTSVHTHPCPDVMMEDEAVTKRSFSLPPPPPSHSPGTRTASDAQSVARAWSPPLRRRRTERSTAKVRFPSRSSESLKWAHRCRHLWEVHQEVGYPFVDHHLFKAGRRPPLHTLIKRRSRHGRAPTQLRTETRAQVFWGVGRVQNTRCDRLPSTHKLHIFVSATPAPNTVHWQMKSTFFF